MLASVLGASLLGPPLRTEQFQLRPPQPFRMSRMDLFHGTTAFALADRDVPRWIAAVLADGDSEDAATLTLAVIQTSLAEGGGGRDRLVRAAAEHFRDELDVALTIERAEVKRGPTPRIEALGSVRAGAQLRTLTIVAWPHEGHHVVAVFSAPSGKWAELAPVLQESLDTFRYEARAPGPPQSWALAFALSIVAALGGSVALWRRRQLRRG